ncbi:hypothetical protein [Sessilibacter sp. MAH4]
MLFFEALYELMIKYYLHKDRAKENVDGPFYTVDIGADCGCGLPEAVAPELLKTSIDCRYQTYFFKQPQTDLKITHVIEAINVCGIHDIRYSGKNPSIISQIRSGQTDFVISKNGEVILNI